MHRFKSAEGILLKQYENDIRKNIQCPPSLGFMQEKVQKGHFLKKALARTEIFWFVLGSYESLESLEH